MGDFLKLLLNGGSLASGSLASKTERFSDTFMSASGNYYYVDSNNTSDHGYETMVFACNKYGHVTSWRDLDCELYDTFEDMEAGHKAMVKKWKAK